MTMYHVCINIREFITSNRYPLRYVGVFKLGSKTCSPKEALDFLLDELAEGHSVIPCEPCDNFDYHNGCQGHPVPEEES